MIENKGAEMEITTIYESAFDEKEINKPYENIFAYIKDLFCMVDSYIQLAFANKNGELIDKNELMANFDRIREHIKCRREKSHNRLIDIEETFGFHDFDRFIFLLALSLEWNSCYELYYAKLNDNPEMKYPNKRLAIMIYGAVYTLNIEERDKLIWNENKAIKYFLITTQSRKSLSDHLFLEEGMAKYLLYNDKTYIFDREHISIEWAGQCDNDLEIYNEITEQLFYMWNEKDEFNFMIQIYGVKGKTEIVQSFLHGINRRVAFCPINVFFTLTKEEMLDKLRKIYANTLIMDAVICLIITGEKEETDSIQLMQAALEEAERMFEFCIVFTEEESEDLFQNCHSFISIGVPPLDVGSRYNLWKKYSENIIYEEDVDIMLMASKCGMYPEEIRDVITTAQMYAIKKNKTAIGNLELQEAIQLKQRGKLLDVAAPINTLYTWKDFIVGKDQKEQMIQICNQVKYKEVVEEQWGFQEKMAYGKGTSVLFHGPPGTGKTMAAQIMANELAMELYRIDISMISSKYIGETEKSISNLFENAKNMNIILFFDEADTLFAKRSEIRNSNDRHANNVTAHLLQRIEDYEGVVILATNFLESIDEAFIRRIQFMMQFEYPSADLRLKIYQSILPEKAECAESLAFEYFAQEFEMSGSNIKEVLVHAAYLAASEGSGISNRHLIKTIKQNYKKYGKILTNEDFGYLMY